MKQAKTDPSDLSQARPPDDDIIIACVYLSQPTIIPFLFSTTMLVLWVQPVQEKVVCVLHSKRVTV